MPAPPGTGLDRRELLLRGLGLAVAVYSGSALRPEAIADGIAAARASGKRGRVLVSVFLEGGADSLSMLFPAGDPLYRKLRPKLALAPDQGVPFSEDDRLRWHYLYLAKEYARHLGHADLLRERIDGATGE